MKRRQYREQGNIMIMAIIVVVVASAMVGVGLNVTGTTGRISDRSRDYAATQSAAEGAVEYGFGLWKRRIIENNRSITTAEANASLSAPTFTGFAYAPAGENGPLQLSALDEYGAPATVPTPAMLDLQAYPGWRGRTFNYSVRAKMQLNPARSNPFKVGIKRSLQYAEVPLFQSMFFFEDNIEFYKPAPMIVSGPVHTNSQGYISSSAGQPLTFQDNVSYVTSYSDDTDPPFSNTWSGWSANATLPPTYPNGEATQLNQVARFEPLGSEPASVINTTDSNPNNDGFRELIEPPSSAATDPPQIAARRLYNKAGIVVNINGSSITVTGKNGATVNSGKATAIRNAVTERTTMFDQREGKNVDVATVDVGLLRTALSSGVGSFNDVIYIHDTTPLGSGNTEPKTIRLKNGGILPTEGLTVASENPVYIQGDYNTGNTGASTNVPANATGNPNNTDASTVPGYDRKPASVIADAVMFLSNSWDDANSANTDLNARVASNTTYNVAVVSGFMPSGHQPTTGSQYGYSGGANNFARFLENWNNKACTYYGSMVELFKSQTFASRWDTGVIYRPPLRRWNFDTNYRTVQPPGSLDAVSWSRGTWAKY